MAQFAPVALLDIILLKVPNQQLTHAQVIIDFL
jgi:hypothetical protein